MMIAGSRATLAFALVSILASGCSGIGGIEGQTDDAGPAVQDVGADAPLDVLADAGSDVASDTSPPGCDKGAPMCASECGSDYFVGQAVCVSGKWVCEKGILVEDCPPNTCWGPPTPGEVCGPNGWECRPDQTGAYKSCPAFMCPECTGFDGPVTQDGCRCECDGGNVVCKKLAKCVTGSESSLPGVSIAFNAGKCSWTLDEAAAGIEIPYAVVVDQGHKNVFPVPQDAGWCGQPGKSGLIVFERLSGDGQKYCLCDTGLCMGPDGKPVTLKKGKYPGKFEWDGRNWDGPSDTGNPKGSPFPTGTYTLSVSAVGTTITPDGPSFTVEGTLEITLTD